MAFLWKPLLAWAPLAVAITGGCLLVYVAVQQNYRQSLNDPQIQMAQDAVQALQSGAPPASLVARGVAIDAAQSLLPFLVIYDDSENILESSGRLNGKVMPKPPEGVFELAREQGDNLPHNTWQPEEGVRIAAVLMHVPKGGFVLSGRNMSSVEEREGALSVDVAIAWLMLIVATFFVQVIVVLLYRER